MKATLTEFDDSGKTKHKESLEVFFASSNRPPIIEIYLPDRGRLHVAISLSAKQVMGLILGRILELVALGK